MATGEKISAQAVATTWSGSDLATIVQSGVNKSITHDVFMDDTQTCKAWVNFNGTGVVAIRDDFNVSSITDNGVGDYTVNFTNALNDVNYSATFGGLATSGQILSVSEESTTILRTTAALRIFTVLTNTAAVIDAPVVSVQIFGS